MNPQLRLDATPPHQRPHTPAAIGILAAVALLAGLFAPPARAQAAPDYAAIVAAPDRSDADRADRQAPRSGEAPCLHRRARRA